MTKKPAQADQILSEITKHIEKSYSSVNPPEKKPRGKRRPGLNSPFTRDELNKLKETMRITQDHFDLDQFGERITHVTEVYDGNKQGYEHFTIRFSRMKRELTEIAKHSLNLTKSLSSLSKGTEAELFEILDAGLPEDLPSEFKVFFGKKDMYDALWDVKEDAPRICFASSYAASKLPKDKGGSTPKNEALRDLIGDLAKVFEESTGDRATLVHERENNQPTGPFFSFVKTYIMIVDPSAYWSESQLDTEIGNVLYK